MGRKLRNSLSSLQENLIPQSSDLNGFREADTVYTMKQKINYDLHYRTRPLPLLADNTDIYIRTGGTRNTTGRSVTFSQTPRSYEVRTDNGTTRSRHGVIVIEDTTGNYKAKCKYCTSCISGSSKTSSNFTTHLKRKDPKIYEEAQKSGTIAKAKVMEQATVDSFITGKKYDQNDVRQCRAIDALTSLIAENMLPLSIVESPSFRKYCHSLDPHFVVPSRKHLSTFLLAKKDEAIKSKLKYILAKAEGVSLTLDL
uniref:BED-type domain-containing protein n=1 Tax=Amphimedon queenslandica TaxID=400682 RepID=A0A1X7VQ34_AMPQE